MTVRAVPPDVTPAPRRPGRGAAGCCGGSRSPLLRSWLQRAAPSGSIASSKATSPAWTSSGLRDRPEAVEVDGPTQPLNILLIGSDTREQPEDLAAGGGEAVAGARSDTTILPHVSADRPGPWR